MIENEVDIRFKVEGLHCAQCIKKVKTLESEEVSWGRINVDLGRQILTVEPRSNFNSDLFTEKIKNLGFKVRRMASLDESDDIQKSENRLFLSRLGVAGALAGNIMLIAVALYSGADETEWSSLLRWLSFFLFLPVLFFSAWPFLYNGFSSMFNLRASIDLPLAIALVGGTGLGFYNLIVGENHIYFDSLSILVFLILGTRYLVYRIQIGYLEPISVRDILGHNTFYDLENKAEKVAFDKVKKGDVLILNSGDALPADGILISDFAEVDNSALTGESMPVVIKHYGDMFSGTKVISEKIKVQLKGNFNTSRAKKLLKNINESVSAKTPLISLTDKAAQYLNLLVIGVGCVFFIYYSNLNMADAVNRTLALLVIACPCALAIASPLCLSLAIRRGFKEGIIIKKPEVLEKIKSCKTIVFDKTGTLTKSNVEVIRWSNELNAEEALILFSLEKFSSHPYAKAIIRSLRSRKLFDVNRELNIENLKESPGIGIEGSYKQNLFSVKRLLNSKENYQTGFYKNNHLISAVEFSSEAYEDSLTEIKKLSKMGYKMYLLTGDQKIVSQKLGQKLGFSIENILTQMTPESKAEFIQKLSQKEDLIYVGDGLNDSLAMSKSRVSISARGSVDASYKASDIHLLKPGISDVISVIKLSKKTLSTIKFNLVLSFIYNISFGVMALSGLIYPLIAAFLMPISSVTVIGHSLLKFKKVKSL